MCTTCVITHGYYVISLIVCVIGINNRLDWCIENIDISTIEPWINDLKRTCVDINIDLRSKVVEEISVVG